MKVFNKMNSIKDNSKPFKEKYYFTEKWLKIKTERHFEK